MTVLGGFIWKKPKKTIFESSIKTFSMLTFKLYDEIFMGNIGFPTTWNLVGSELHNSECYNYPRHSETILRTKP